MNWRAILLGALLGISGPIVGKAMSAEPIKNTVPAVYAKITKQEVIWMYTMKTRFWDDGTKVTVFYLPYESAAHVEFCSKVLGITVDRFSRNVDTYINRGNAAYFRKVEFESSVISSVARVPGAIGYINANELAVNINDRVEIFEIVD